MSISLFMNAYTIKCYQDKKKWMQYNSIIIMNRNFKEGKRTLNIKS